MRSTRVRSSPVWASLHRIKGELTATCEDVLGFGHGRIDYEDGTCRVRRTGFTRDDVISLGRDAEAPAHVHLETLLTKPTLGWS